MEKSRRLLGTLKFNLLKHVTVNLNAGELNAPVSKSSTVHLPTP